MYIIGEIKVLYVYVFTITTNIFIPHCMKFDIKKCFYLLYYINIYISNRCSAGVWKFNTYNKGWDYCYRPKYSILVPSWPQPSLLLQQYVLSDQSHQFDDV